MQCCAVFPAVVRERESTSYSFNSSTPRPLTVSRENTYALENTYVNLLLE